MARVMRPMAALALGRVLLGTGRAGGGGAAASPPTICRQVLPKLVLTQTPVVVPLEATRPMLPTPISRRLLLNGSMIRSVTEASGPATVPPAARNICDVT